MRVEFHDGFRHPKKHDATTVIIRDEHENPLAVAVETAVGIYVYKATDPGYKEALKQLGIRNTVIVDRFDPDSHYGEGECSEPPSGSS